MGGSLEQSVERFRAEPWVISALDAARALAAIYVVIHHVSGAWGGGGAAGALFRFGQEAVIVFFVMSGAVIFMNEYNCLNDIVGYALRRIRRIYPPLIIAMIISTAIAIDNGSFSQSFNIWEMLGNILGLQDIKALKPGVWVDPFLGNSPLWSLSYEIAFYIIFIPLLALWRRSAAVSHFVGIVSVVSYISYVLWPNHISLVLAYFQVWWFGAMAASAAMRGGKTILSIPVEFAWTVILCLVSAITVYFVGYRGFGFYPFLQFRHFFIALIIVSAAFSPLGVWLGQRMRFGAKVWAFGASISYGLYVFHYPILLQWRRIDSVKTMVVAVLVLVAAAWLFDRKVNGWLPRIRRALPAS